MSCLFLSSQVNSLTYSNEYSIYNFGGMLACARVYEKKARVRGKKGYLCGKYV
jgi:hypothetical protein